MLGGELSFHFLNVMLMTAIVAPLVLWRYRKAVLAGMQSSSGAALSLAPALGARPRALDPAAPSLDAKLVWERRVLRRIFVAVVGALLVPVLLLAVNEAILNGLEVTPANVWLIAGAALLMAVPIVGVLIALPIGRTLVLGVATVAAFAVLLVVVSMLQRVFAGKTPTLDQLRNAFVFVEYAAYMLWLPLVLAAALGNRRVRGVAPFIFAGLFVFAVAPLLGVRVTQALGGMRWSAEWVLAGGIHVGAIVLALPVGALAWWRLSALARGYDAKRFSDAQLLANSWWLMFVAVHAVEQVAVHPETEAMLRIALVDTVVYLLFPFLLAHALARIDRGLARPPKRMLLVLRVFGDRARTGALFARIASRWQRFGPVTTIAAPDAAADTVDPGDLLRFATGRIGESFVTSKDDLVQRLATMDVEADRDGRFRIDEFCCRDDTWQATVVALIARADAIVMDLRGFGAARRGAEFELEQLASRAAPERVVLVVDASTDRALVAHAIEGAKAPMLVVEAQRGSA
ncbi:MAG TPA: hypothetical protein VFF43_02590, partial [Caldimonas sp.]|nr:hypothetical protein [Caldimonas sp.]